MSLRCATRCLGVALYASTAGACAQPATHPATAQAPAAIVVAEIVLPPAPPLADVLRVTVKPTSRTPAWQALLQATVRADRQPASALRLPPWTLHPPDQEATFVVRMAPALVDAGRAGQKLLLSVTAVPLNAADTQSPVPSFSVKAAWDVLRE